MSQKKFFIIIAIILVVFVVSLGAYYFMIVSNPNGSKGDILSGFKQFFPFGSNSSTSTPVATNPIVDQPVGTTTNYNLKLRKIWSEPVAGAGLIDVKAGTVVRHVEKATGHIYETELFSPNQNRISNTTIPLIYNAVWGNKNKSLIAQYLLDDNETVNTYLLTVKNNATTTENAITGYYLADNVDSISTFGNTVFYLQKTDTGTKGFMGALDSTNKKQIWDSPLRELISQSINDTTVALTTKPYPNVSGYLYTVTNNGVVRKILGNIAGLSAVVSLDTSKVLYLTQTNSAQMYLYDKKSDSSITLTPTTFPEKCVWSKKDNTIVYCAVPKESLNGSSLNSWYTGSVSFTDDIWRYNLKQNTSAIVGSLSDQSGEAIDVIKPLLSDSEQYIVFINKIDGSLWSLDLTK